MLKNRLATHTFLIIACMLQSCLAENFLIKSPAILSQAEVDQLPRFWSATFGARDGSYNFLYHDDRVAVSIQGENFPTYTSSLWQELSDNINRVAPAEEDGGYHIDEMRSLAREANLPQSMNLHDAAQFIKNHTVVFYTGAGISLAAGVEDMARLMKALGMNPQAPAAEYAEQLIQHEAEILKNFAAFCDRAFTAAPTQAHCALAEIALQKGTQILTENFDFLHQRSGIKPYCMDASSLRKEVSPQEFQTIDAVVCIGLSHDDRGFLTWYKLHNPQGIIIAFDISIPHYLGTEDFLVQDDAQETIRAVQNEIKIL